MALRIATNSSNGVKWIIVHWKSILRGMDPLFRCRLVMAKTASRRTCYTTSHDVPLMKVIVNVTTYLLALSNCASVPAAGSLHKELFERVGLKQLNQLLLSIIWRCHLSTYPFYSGPVEHNRNCYRLFKNK